MPASLDADGAIQFNPDTDEEANEWLDLFRTTSCVVLNEDGSIRAATPEDKQFHYIYTPPCSS